MNSKLTKTARRILIYRIGQLGDTIVSLPAIWAIRKYFERDHLGLISDVHEDGNYVVVRSVLPPNGLIDQWLNYPARYDGTSLRGMAKVLYDLRTHRFDTLVYLAPRKRTYYQIQRDLIFFRLAGIHNFIGCRGFKPLPKKSSNRLLPMLEHEADHLLYRLSIDGIPIPPSGHGMMDLKLTATERSDAHTWLVKHCGEAFYNRCLVGIGPSSKISSKKWPVECYAELGRRLNKEMGLFPVVFGGPEDGKIAKSLIAHWGQGISAAGQLTVRQSAAALSYCNLYVGNDTGTMHLAASVGTTCVVAFSAQYYPGIWYPYGNGHVVLRKSVPCEGCMLAVCNRDLYCLRAISVEEMMDACKSVTEQLNHLNNNVHP